jgi:hypothetical protein
MRMRPGMTAAAFAAAAATMVLPALAQQEPPTVEQSPAASTPQQGASPSDVSPQVHCRRARPSKRNSLKQCRAAPPKARTVRIGPIEFKVRGQHPDSISYFR